MKFQSYNTCGFEFRSSNKKESCFPWNNLNVMGIMEEEVYGAESLRS